MTKGGCPPWCTGEDLDGVHEGHDVPAGDAVQTVADFASEVPLQMWVTPMAEGGTAWLQLHDGESGDRGLGLDLQPDDARHLARVLTETADLIDPKE